MGELTLNINNRTFNLTCDDGQEQRVQELAGYLDTRLRELAQGAGTSSESHLLILNSLMMADEIFELRSHIGELGGEIDHERARSADELVIADIIEELADRIDGLADRIQKA